MEAPGRGYAMRAVRRDGGPCLDLDDPVCAGALVSVLDSTPVGIAVLSRADLRFELVNAAFRALTPRPDIDPVGRRYLEVWPEDGPVALAAVQRVRETGEPCHVEDHAVRDGGTLRRFSFHVKEVPWPGGPGVLVVLWETTALWEAMSEAENAARRAARRASELERILDDLRHLEAARDDLVAMVSHDLRSPLGAVLSQSHLLRAEACEPARVVERAATIARNCERMRSMIDDLLEATMLEAGQLRIRPAELDLASFAREVVERHRGALAVDRVRVEAPGRVPAHADPERLERILVNLLSNALKYSPPEAEVTVRVDPAEGGATLAVADRGVGISPDDLPRVFERFFRAHGARQTEGLGLGLYITRLLVYAHGGRVEAESEPGRGSTFRVFLPGQRPFPTPPPGRKLARG